MPNQPPGKAVSIGTREADVTLGVKLVDALSDWLSTDDVRQKAASTQRGYDRVVRLMGQLVEEKKLPVYAADFMPEHIDVVIAALRPGVSMRPRARNVPRPRSEASLNTDRTILRKITAYFQRAEITRDDRGRYIKFAKAGGRNRNYSDLCLDSPEQAGELLEAAGRRHPRDRVVVALGLFCGLRESEMLNLRLRDVDLRRKTMDFYREKQDAYHFVDLNDAAVDELRSYLEWYEAYYAPLHEKMYVAPARAVHVAKVSNAEAINPRWPIIPDRRASGFRRDIKILLAQIGKPVAEGQGIHVLRRTFANSMIDAGLDIRDVQEALGHKSQATTERYLNRSFERERLRRQYQRPDFRLWGEPATRSSGNVVDIREIRGRRTQTG